MISEFSSFFLFFFWNSSWVAFGTKLAGRCRNTAIRVGGGGGGYLKDQLRPAKQASDIFTFLPGVDLFRNLYCKLFLSCQHPMLAFCFSKRGKGGKDIVAVTLLCFTFFFYNFVLLFPDVCLSCSLFLLNLHRVHQCLFGLVRDM